VVVSVVAIAATPGYEKMKIQALGINKPVEDNRAEGVRGVLTLLPQLLLQQILLLLLLLTLKLN
jgi:hypothetical protein